MERVFFSFLKFSIEFGLHESVFFFYIFLHAFLALLAAFPDVADARLRSAREERGRQFYFWKAHRAAQSLLDACSFRGRVRARRLLELEGGDGEAFGEPQARLEGDPLRRGVVDVDLGDGEPEEQLLGLHPGDPPDPAVLDERRHLGGVGDLPLDLLEGVLAFPPLRHPEEPGGAVEAELRYVLQGEQPRREGELPEQRLDLLPALGVPTEDLRAVAVALHDLGRHLPLGLSACGVPFPPGGRWEEAKLEHPLKHAVGGWRGVRETLLRAARERGQVNGYGWVFGIQSV